MQTLGLIDLDRIWFKVVGGYHVLFLNYNSREENGMTIETTRLINSEVTKRIEELNSDLNSQIRESVNSAITKKLLPTIQNTLGNQHVGFRADSKLNHRR